MAKGIKEKKAGCCEYQSKYGSYCGRKIDKRYPDVEGRNYCIFHSHNDDKEEEFYKLINETIDKANNEVLKAIDAINSKETEGKTRNEKIETIRKEKWLNFEGFYFPRTADFCKKKFEPYMDFSTAIFSGKANFLSSLFNGEIDFYKTTFIEEACFSSAVFSGAVKFWDTIFCAAVYFSRPIFRGEAYFSDATFSGKARFFRAVFNRDTIFSKVSFNCKAEFSYTSFGSWTDFRNTAFNEEVDFNGSTFNGKASFIAVTFNRRANFGWATFSGEVNFRCKIKESTTFNYSKFIKRGIFTDVDLSNASFEGAELHNSLIQDIQYSSTTKKGIIIDTFTANTNRIFARDAADYNYIINMEKKCDRLKSNSLIFLKDENLTKEGLINRFKWELLRTGMDLWKITSNYGRSFALWFAWSLGIALFFGFLYMLPLKDQLHYARHTTVTIEKSVVEGRPVEKLNDNLKTYDDIAWFTPFYYSIVTFTTLGFGDVVPDTGVARAVVALEVFLGYIMLGGLISIFANKLARRA